MRNNASILRDRVDIVTVTSVHQGGGNYADVETVAHTSVPAQVRYLRAQEAIRAGRPEASTDGVVTIRYRDGITTDHRVRHQGRTLYVHGVIRVDEQGQASDRGRWLELVVTRDG